ncbi:hypothetical protein BS47DRAFT_732700 [Hydnum rufescens UP504]|uniref:CCL2-like lectin domain-containing protein n=1 Tax=Hydnum rufescens UP504 TaxID=1448309 RepID=A0A9P6DV21_9AGAM|nr:hypothetical protein BS47DRAFT_732700 [Hydnum rufescens UP504]
MTPMYQGQEAAKNTSCLPGLISIYGHPTPTQAMAENIVIPSSYYIINRVLSPSGVKLAVQYNGPDNKLTLAPLDETNRNQRWVLERSRDKSTTIVPSNFEDQQAAPHDSSDSFVIAEVAVTPQLWVFKNDESM